MRPVFNAARYPQFGPAYPFAFSSDRDGCPQEGASVRFAWNESGLFVQAELEDSVLIQKNRQNEQFHYQSGDVFELFVKPLNEFYCWEMYATPFGNRTTIFFPQNCEGMTLDQFLKDHPFQGLEVTSTEFSKPRENSRVEAQPPSRGWKTQMFVPIAQLTALGAGWGDGTEWTVFCGRYNYNSDDLSDPELSMAPALSATNYHLVDEYARLKLCAE
ncbi:DOMON domain-containing protein [Tichowtungia aerotolerans]|uniref:Carbohydrate-binding domain-containing protein n=1 Tax=Tichowtungia aerotolerans TaxID=2697043 RepID=A0A6P1M504_9BACT|nr:hypothetical protein [Tichowtungia aerotolerans]QHI69132.1 hypothetical protein GT409_06610 [Tichowtungia aerotolerans]